MVTLKFYATLVIKNIRKELDDLDDSELEEYHLFIQDESEKYENKEFSEDDGIDVFSTIKRRKGQQHKLRRKLLSNYNNKCALCDIIEPKLLKTSHIKRWAESSKKERIDLSNSILLCALHDGLFEHGFISFSDEYDVLFSNRFDFKKQKISTALTFTPPISHAPEAKYLKEHRIRHSYE